MYLNEQEYFINLAQEKNFTRAAEKSCISQPALSKAIARLEKEYGCSLVTREGRSVALTEAGELYLSAAYHMLQIRQDAYDKIQAMRRSKAPRLRIGINRQYSQQRFAEALRKNYHDYPGDLPDVYEIDSEQALAMLRGGLLDMAVALQDERKLPRDFLGFPLSTEHLAAYLPNTDEFQFIIQTYSCGSKIPVELLDGKTALHTAPGANFDQILQGYFEAQKVTPNYVCVIYEIITAIEAVKHGMGMAFSYLSRADQFRCPHYYHITPDPPLRHYIFLLPDTQITPQIQFLIQILQKNQIAGEKKTNTI